jgi:O-antigen/teichoic acid export membrane protein
MTCRGLISRGRRRLKTIPLGERLAAGAFWTMAGTVAARLLTLPASVLLARLMGPKHYGELGVIQSSIEFFSTFAGFGLSLTATKHIAEFRAQDPARAGRILALSSATAVGTGLLVSALLFVLAPWLAAHTLAAPQLTGLLRIGAGVLFLVAVTSAQSGALYGFEAFRVSARVQTAVGFVNVPFLVGGYWFGGLTGVLWGMIAVRAFEFVLKQRAVAAEARRGGVPVHYKGCSGELPVLWRFSLPALLSGALVAPVYWVCSAILVNRPNGYTEMGVFNAANQWYSALLFLPVTLGTSLLPLLSDRFGAGDSRGSAGVLGFMLRLNAAILAPCVLILSLLSPYIMRVYGSAYGHAGSTLVLVVLTAGLFAVLMPVGDVIAASGRMWLGCAMNLGWALVFIVTTLCFVGSGSVGLAGARLIAYAVHAVWTLFFACRIIRQARARSGPESSASRSDSSSFPAGPVPAELA